MNNLKSPLSGLDETQANAASHRDGPAIVLAAPGSGKTRVIVGRVKYLTGILNIPAENILVVTFSRAAADEMKARYVCRNSSSGNRVTFGTFHSVFFSILREELAFSYRSIIHEKRKYDVVSAFVKAYIPEFSNMTNQAELISGALFQISRIKGSFELAFPNDPHFIKIFKGYEDYLRKFALLDFDDMLRLCFNLLSQRPEVLKRWQKKFKYILVDEFQDINRLQYECLKLLAAPLNNIFAVGDDDQSIYGFRGSDPVIMRQFLIDFPNAVKFNMNKNYRSKEAIINAAARVIRKNKGRLKAKRFQSFERISNFFKKFDLYFKFGGFETSAGIVSFREFTDKSAESEGICLEIKRLQNLKPSDAPANSGTIAILIRRHLEAENLIHYLKQHGISYELSGKASKASTNFIHDDNLQTAVNSVKIMTMHASKGLEFDTVFIPGVNEGNIPHLEALKGAKGSFSGGTCNGTALEEERRLFYVAMTRAKSRLYISWTSQVNHMASSPSQFIKPLISRQFPPLIN